MEMKSSIILRTNNRPDYFSQALKSIEYQTNKNWEVIIFDDSGLNENLKIINDFKQRNKNKRVVYLTSLDPFYFFKKSWQYMCDLSEGDILIRLDDDDLLSRDCVEYFLTTYKKYPDLDLSYGSSATFDGKNIVKITQTRTPYEIPKTTTAWLPYLKDNNIPWESPWAYQDNFYDVPQHYTSINHASILDKLCVYHTYVVRKSSIEKVKDKFDITSNFVDDLEFFGTMEYLGLKHTSLKKITTYVRQHDLDRVTSKKTEIKIDIDRTRKKVEIHRPNNFKTNILTLNDEDNFTYEINPKLISEFREVLSYCTNNIKNKETLSFNGDKTKFKKAYVYYANEKYFDIVSKSAESIRQFTDTPIIVYLLNSDRKIDVPNTTTINWEYTDQTDDNSNQYIEHDSNQFFIERKNKNIYKLLIQRPLITKHALENYSDVICYVDSDSIATKYCDRIFDMYNKESDYPYFVEGIYDYMHFYGRGGAESKEDLSTTLEHPACELFNVNQYIRERYRQTGYYVAGQNSIEFLNEWHEMCSHPEILNDHVKFAPYHEETIANVLLWKRNSLKGLPYIYCNGSTNEIDEIYDNIGFSGNHNNIRTLFKIPSHENELLFFHGEKRIDMMEEMRLKLKRKFIYNIDGSKNWGDIISILTLDHFSKRKINKDNVMHFEDDIPFKNGKMHAIGSTLRFLKSNDYIWGAGCISQEEIEDHPKKVYAVRGPLTRNELIKKGIDCPEIYGDPALLFPQIYNPKVEVKYEYGIIPHYIDYTDLEVIRLLDTLEKKGIKVINITSGIYEFIDQIKEVKYIMSSSLHGLIASDAYGIPNARISLTNKLIGGDFKFEDYRLSVNKKENNIEKMTNENYEKIINNLKFELGDTSIKDGLLSNNPWSDPEFPYYENNDKLKVLFVAPHLSTGGMPSFLLKRIELIQKYSPEIDIYVVEYSLYSNAYVVQRDQIINLLPHNRFWSLGWFGGNDDEKLKLIDIIKENKIDIVHIEEIPEGFDPFNKIPDKILNLLYDNNRTWRVVETCHNIWFDPKTMKNYNPDAYAFCTPYHKQFTFSRETQHCDVIQFPIENQFRSESDKVESQIKLGLDTNKIHVLNVGLWTPGKNQKEGVELARLLEKTNPEIEFHFVGNQASNFQEYWKPIMEDLPSNVKVWGERNDVDVFMKSCDVFMFNSTWECNPLVLRESISYGLKIISRNLPQYLDMFTKYITEIDDSLQTTKDRLLNLISSRETYYLPSGQSLSFAESHSNFYKEVKSKPVVINRPKLSNVKINQHFVEKPFLEILGESDSTFDIKIYDDNGKLYYENNLPSNRWIRLNRSYFTKWNTKIWENGNLIYDDVLDYSNKRVLISFDSSSLGDTIAWIPYCLEFKKKHNCHVIVSTFWNKFFIKTYPELEFVNPGSIVNNINGLYKLGWFYDADKEPVLPNIIPLQKAATNILGLEYTEIKPNIYFKESSKPYNNSKYVTIATNSTAGCKFWTKEGWQGVVDFLVGMGYKVVNVSKEDYPLKNVIKIKNTSIENTMNVIHHSEFFIGLSSGLSWLSWALGTHVFMISNFTEPDHEFSSNCTRIINKSVCNGCWNKSEFKFDKGDWYWCPIHKGTDRQFECHTSITSEMVINEIKKRSFV
jgi:autotransporter strand-loop-strand O-heptosyltransferase